MTFRRDGVRGEMSKKRLGHVTGMFPSRTELDGVVTVFIDGFVGDDLDAVELEDCARGADPRCWVEEGGHSFFYGDCAGAERECFGFAFEGGLGGGFEGGEIGGMVEAVGTGGFERSDAE